MTANQDISTGLLARLQSAGGRSAAGLRRSLRSNDFAQILACGVAGTFIGALVDLLRQAVEKFHQLNFLLGRHGLLSTGIGVSPERIVVVPLLGGLAVGLFALWTSRMRGHDIVDPIEANAMYGGRMSLRDSMRLTFATVLSNAAGASLGMEAGYSQIGAGLFSALARNFGLRREDMRVFVTAGASAAIAAAFNAPLAGAFYGFELILAQYTVRALAPIAVACVAATLAQDALSHPPVLFHAPAGTPHETISYVLFGAMGVLAAALAILAMLAVTWVERGARRLPLPEWLRPALGGLLLSVVALSFPQVLGSGHGGIQYHLDLHWTLLPLLALLFAKLVASAISVGSGFRGGLFSSSLFLGCLFGAAFAQGVALLDPALSQQYDAFVIVGMASIAAAIIGAPLTMVFLVLEGTGDFPLTVGVLIGVVTASTISRLAFGYSFSTWRFHQRGLGIRSAHDVGWIADLTVGRLMRSDPKVVAEDMTIAMLRKKHPIGSAKRIFVTDGEGRFKGLLDLAKVYDAEYDADSDSRRVGSLARDCAVLLPGENVRTAAARFETSESEVLPVVDSRADRKLVGYLTEAFALRRYTQEFERRRSAELGERDLFSIGPIPRA
ncbi:MAG TPA: chloride channel protein [Rhizomicrobium sp.]|nr:chloride channel protein [Rhizomicrobium sp.]